MINNGYTVPSITLYYLGLTFPVHGSDGPPESRSATVDSRISPSYTRTVLSVSTGKSASRKLRSAFLLGIFLLKRHLKINVSKCSITISKLSHLLSSDHINQVAQSSKGCQCPNSYTDPVRQVARFITDILQGAGLHWMTRRSIRIPLATLGIAVNGLVADQLVTAGALVTHFQDFGRIERLGFHQRTVFNHRRLAAEILCKDSS